MSRGDEPAEGRVSAVLRVVVTDHAFPDLESERRVLGAIGAEIDVLQQSEPAALVPLVREADALLVQFAPIDERVVAALDRCRVIVRYGIGVDNVDIDAATERGIPVVNVPDYALDEVADHAMTLLLAAARKLPAMTRLVREGSWQQSPGRPLHSLAGRNLGIAGFGAIGRRVADRARAFGLHVQAYDPYVPGEAFEEHGAARVDFETLLESSDLLSVHLPLTDETHHLFDARAFAAVRPGLTLVNTSRGSVIDTDALVEALEAGIVAWAALDVLEEEPPAPDAAIVTHPHATVTSHCAWYTEEALQRLQLHAAHEVARALTGEPLRHVVNRASLAERR